MITLPASAFTYSRGVFAAEISTLRLSSINAGVAIRSPSGEVVRYHVASIDYTPDGESAGWRLKPVIEDVWRVPASERTSVLIIND